MSNSKFLKTLEEKYSPLSGGTQFGSTPLSTIPLKDAKGLWDALYGSINIVQINDGIITPGILEMRLLNSIHNTMR